MTSLLLISAFNGGSHKQWAEDVLHRVLQPMSALTVRFLHLPAQQWKWRMLGGAVTLARMLDEDRSDVPIDVIVCDGMFDLTTFLALSRRRTARAKVLLYMHENQLTFPLHTDIAKGAFRNQDGERDRHYAFVNFVSMLAADCVAFNSEHHRREWFAALPAFLNHYRDYKELDTVPLIRDKSIVLHCGVDLSVRLARPELVVAVDDDSVPPLILWNMRWEYDKCPDVFLRALIDVANDGVAFRVAICGARETHTDNSHDALLAQLGDRIVHHGLAPDALYREMLWNADVTVSTAVHEYFGIAVVEAMACEVFPLLPRRLSYPELVPAEFHSACLYFDEKHLRHRLKQLLTDDAPTRRSVAEQLARSVRSRFDWDNAMTNTYRERIQSLLPTASAAASSSSP
jgi:glycosyltransferase involved in cell wall biosynthesis